MNAKNRNKNRMELIENCANAIYSYLQSHSDNGGFVQRIVISEGGYDRYAQIAVLLNIQSIYSIKKCVQEAIEIAYETNAKQKRQYGIKLCGFRIVFQLTNDKGKYILLETVDYSIANSLRAP